MNARKYAVFTMDVEAFSDTECFSTAGIRTDAEFLDGLDEYIALLERHGIQGTLFTVGDLAPRIAERIRGFLDRGHRLALHSYAHIAPVQVELDQFRERTQKALEEMQALFGVQPQGYRAPCFRMDRQHLEVLRQLGLRYDSSSLGFPKASRGTKLELDGFRQLRREIYCRDGFYEFGLAGKKLFGKNFPISGGGYVRLSNGGFIRALIRQYLRRNDYYVFYLHPFELTKQKVPVYKKLKKHDQFYLRRGLGRFRTRVEWIIRKLKKNGYQFVTFDELADIMDREQKETV